MENKKKWILAEDRLFNSDPAQKKIAQELYKKIENLPIVSPHGHVDARLFLGEEGSFGSPADLLIIPDHYVTRMLYSQGITLAELGVPRQDGRAVENDHRKVWQRFAENFYLFRGTPTGIWITYVLIKLFGIEQKLNGQTAQDIYDQLQAKLALPEFKPRRLFERFNLEILTTTDGAADSLDTLKAIRKSGWNAKIVPTFRPDFVVNLDTENWMGQIQALSQASGIHVHDYASYIAALENRRAFFKEMGAIATDHAVLTPYTVALSPAEAEAIFQRGLKGSFTPEDAARFTGHMLLEMARMSIEDGLVMQVHVGSYRNHNTEVFQDFGRDKGADIPVSSEFTRNLQPLLTKYGSHPDLTLLLFTLDESVYSRELAPLAGHYPAVKLGPPWWFHDSINGMTRYFDLVMETAGLYNTAGFNDDTRAFPSIPARHDVWRRASANWVAGLVVRGMVDLEEGHEMVVDLAYNQVKKVYKIK